MQSGFDNAFVKPIDIGLLQRTLRNVAASNQPVEWQSRSA
jgi:hypothetical protein